MTRRPPGDTEVMATMVAVATAGVSIGASYLVWDLLPTEYMGRFRMGAEQWWLIIGEATLVWLLAFFMIRETDRPWPALFLGCAAFAILLVVELAVSPWWRQSLSR